MKCRDIEAFLNSVGEKDTFKSSFTELSSSRGDGTGKSLIISDKKAYNFDKIAKFFFPDNPPKSADALLIERKENSKRANITFVEFKTGFERDARCLDDPDNSEKTCTRLTQKIKDELYNKLYLKAIESIWVLTQHIARECKEESWNEYYYKIHYVAVTDEAFDAREAAYLEILGKGENPDNIFTGIKDSLSRLGKPSKLGNSMYYDTVLTMNKRQFERDYLQKCDE